MICFDTNVVIEILNGRTTHVREKLEAALKAGNEITISALVCAELWYGVGRSAHHERNARRIEDFMSLGFGILDFGPDDAREGGLIRAALARAGTPIGPYDVLIAAQARRRDALLVTANAREFSRIPGLKSEDWTLPLGT